MDSNDKVIDLQTMFYKKKMFVVDECHLIRINYFSSIIGLSKAMGAQ